MKFKLKRNIKTTNEYTIYNKGITKNVTATKKIKIKENNRTFVCKFLLCKIMGGIPRI